MGRVKEFSDFNFKSLDKEHEENSSRIKKVSRKDIAIIGISAKMPLADNLEEFWNNIKNGKDCIRGMNKERQKDCDSYLYFLNKSLMDIQYEEGASIDDIDKFDYEFFRISPKEASLIDPNQRLFLQIAWSALEDSGYIGESLKGSRTGVFLGFASDPEYKDMIENINPELLYTALPGNIRSIIASRISYILDLRGPSMIIDTACSSSLVAVHQACQSIRNEECDMAIAGGVQVHLLPFRKTRVGIESSDMRTKTFDMASDGTGAGEGVIAFILKPLYMAERDGDNVYAVIKGSAVNQDGSSIGITAPNVAAQESVLVSAWRDAGIDADTITYIEAHGTGTKLGDPIEIDAINRAFVRFTAKKQFCAVSSVKSNIGHLDNSAGAAGLLKAVLSLKNRQLAPNLHFNRPNEKINFVNSPVYVNNDLQDWDSNNLPRRCGVSSFGMSGTNCHIVLEEYFKSQGESLKNCDKSHILLLSTKNRYSLVELIKKYLVYFSKPQSESISNICYTSCAGREHYNLRLAVILKESGDFISKFSKLNLERENFLDIEGVFFGEHRVIAAEDEKTKAGDITEKEKSELTRRFHAKASKGEIRLKEICELYVAGADINWKALAFDKPMKRVALPAYPFKPMRCWLDIPLADMQNIGVDTKDIFHTTKWEIDELRPIERNDRSGKVLIIKTDSNNLSNLLTDKLKGVYEQVIEANISNGFKQLSPDVYCIQNIEEDFVKIFEIIKKHNIKNVIHAVMLSQGVESSDEYILRKRQSIGLYSLLNTIKGIVRNEIRYELEMTIITDYAHAVVEDQHSVLPENSMLFGMAKSIKWEYPNIICKCIDIDNNTDINKMAEEIKAKSGSFVTAYRNNNRYSEKVVQVKLNTDSFETVKIKDNGTYVISGGVGRIGLEMAKYLASKKSVNLILINRSKFPERDQWDSVIQDKPMDVQAERIKEIRFIESLGSSVILHNADISDENQLKAALEYIRNKFGRIDGLIHGAGIGVGLTGVPTDLDSEEIYEQVLSAKVRGTWLLSKLTENDKLDFFIMFSSAITLIGGVGSGSYTAANYYLDSFAGYMTAKGRKALTINWPAWNKDKLIEKLKINENKQIMKIISPDMAIMAFHKALHSSFNRIIIGEFNYKGSLFDMQEHLPFTFTEKLASAINRQIELQRLSKNNKAETKEMKLTGSSKGIYSDIEKRIANIWREVLGFDEISINSNFFEIGGDSLMLVKAQKLMEIEFPGKIKLPDFFAYSTINKLAKFITGFEQKEADAQGDVPDLKPDNKDEIYKLIKDIESGNIDIENAINIYGMLEVNNGK